MQNTTLEMESAANQGPSPEPPAVNQAEMVRTVRSMLDRWWVMLLSVALFVGLGVFYVMKAPKLYESTATVQIDEDQPRILRNDELQARDLQTLDYLQTIAQSFKSRALLERVVQSNNLATDPNFFGPGKKETPTAEDIAEKLDDEVNVRLRRGTRLIDITVTHHVPKLAQTIANSIVEQFLVVGAERHVSSSEVVNDFLVNEAARLRKKLQESENALQTYKEQTKASSLDERQNTVVSELRELSTRATEAKSARLRAETLYNQATQLGNNIPALLTLPSVASDPTVVALQMNLGRAENDFVALRQRYKDKHPRYITAMTQIQGLRSDLTNAALKTIQTLRASLEGARASEQALNNAQREQEAQALELNKLAIQYNVLSREVESDRTLYQSVLNRMKEATVTKELRPTPVRILQPAYLPEKPFSPNKPLVLGIAALVGIMAGLAMIFSLGMLDNSVKSVDEAEQMLGMPVLATIPELGGIKRTKTPLVMVDQPLSIAAESFRTLRTSLTISAREGGSKVFLFTSALPAEGKTFCSVNYAASLAQVGLKTLLIDVDLRRPMVETWLSGKQTGNPGVTDYLHGRKSFKEVLQDTKLENLNYIPGGTTAANPAELLATKGIVNLINEALKQYDRVVLDSAPIHAVSDTLLICRSVEAVCLIMRASQTPSRSVHRCIRLLGNAGAPLIGAVMNRMTLGKGHDYTYRGHYGSKGVYGATK